MAPDPYIVNALNTLRARRDTIDRAIRALEELDDDAVMNGSSTSGPISEGRARARARRGSGPGGRSGVRAVLRSAAGQPLTPEQLADAMLANGWQTDAENPPRAARAAANRL